MQKRAISCKRLSAPRQARFPALLRNKMNELHAKLVGKLTDRTATIGIVGLGYVGLPLVLRFCEVGYRVIGFDIDQPKVAELNSGRSYIEHIAHGRVAQA